MPANIRFKFYPTRESIKLENKFAVTALVVPVQKSMEEAYPVIKECTKGIKNSLSSICYVYAIFWITRFGNTFLPRWISK